MHNSTSTHTPPPITLRHLALLVPLAAALWAGLATPGRAATPPPTKVAAVPAAPTDATNAADAADARTTAKCRSDLLTFDKRMHEEGYMFRGAGYGYPMSGYSYDESRPMPMGSERSRSPAGYLRARPGYEVRTLMASSRILAEHGQEQACEASLATASDVYASYTADMRNHDVPGTAMSRRRNEQLAGARPISIGTSYRSDQLIGTDVLNPHGTDLGSVDDLVMSPQSGKIVYLVIGRGGFFGIDEKYVPVPWKYFKATAGTSLLVLDTSKSVMEAAPEVKEDAFSAAGGFAQQSQKVDAYWKGQLSK